MVIEISEHEMIERYGDELKKAASRAKEMLTAEEKDKPRIFIDFIGALKRAAGSAHQICLNQENPNFLSIRDTIEKVIEVGETLPTFNQTQNGMWLSIKQSLEMLSQNGLRMAQSKAMKRSDVLENLNIRQERSSARDYVSQGKIII